MSRSNNDNDNPSYIRRSNFKTYSRVCYSDPNQPGKMICKEDENINGNRNHKEVVYNTNSHTNQYQNTQNIENIENNHGFIPFLKTLFKRNDDYSQSTNQSQNHNINSNYHHNNNHINNQLFEMNQIGNDIFNSFFSDPFFRDPIDSLINNFDREFVIDFGNYNNHNYHNNYHNYDNTDNRGFNSSSQRKRPSNYNNIKVYDV